MKVSDLFHAQMEPALSEWIRQFSSPLDLFASIHILFERLKLQRVEGAVEDGAIIIGPVHVGAGSVVHSHATIRGPVIIGPRAVVNGHSEIGPACYIGMQCIIGHGAYITESMLMNGVLVSPGAFVGRSVLGVGATVGPHAVIGHSELTPAARPFQSGSQLPTLLGDYSSVGASSTMNPGTVVGCRTSIGSGVVADGIYEANRSVTLTQKLEIQSSADEAV
jgi:NDP-sugar pyrophosphorylase family protein